MKWGRRRRKKGSCHARMTDGGRKYKIRRKKKKKGGIKKKERTDAVVRNEPDKEIVLFSRYCRYCYTTAFSKDFMGLELC